MPPRGAGRSKAAHSLLQLAGGRLESLGCNKRRLLRLLAKQHSLHQRFQVGPVRCSPSYK